MNNTVSVIGAGSWGTAIADLLAKKGLLVKLWIREEELLDKIKITKENYMYLPEVVLADNIIFSGDLEYCCQGSHIVVIAVPSHFVRGIAKTIKPFLKKEQIIVNLAKGIENDTLLRMSQIIEECIPDNPVGVLSGPSHAEEVAKGVPTALVASSIHKVTAEKIQDTFMCSRLRVYTNPDIIGVELGGALKNVIALCAGILEGLGFGDNTKAALMTRGITEMSRLGEAMGAKKNTFSGLSGIGDLIVTCSSMHSRNRRAGMDIGHGKTLEEVLAGTNMVVEGVKATKSAYQLAGKLNIEMPITNELYGVLYEKKDVSQSVNNLMIRTKKHEMEEVADNSITSW